MNHKLDTCQRRRRYKVWTPRTGRTSPDAEKVAWPKRHSAYRRVSPRLLPTRIRRSVVLSHRICRQLSPIIVTCASLLTARSAASALHAPGTSSPGPFSAQSRHSLGTVSAQSRHSLGTVSAQSRSRAHVPRAHAFSPRVLAPSAFFRPEIFQSEDYDLL